MEAKPRNTMALKIAGSKSAGGKPGLTEEQKALLYNYLRQINADMGPAFVQVGEYDPEVFRALDMIAKGKSILLKKTY